jgi:hypothetical protein
MKQYATLRTLRKPLANENGILIEIPKTPHLFIGQGVIVFQLFSHLALGYNTDVNEVGA